MIGGGLALIAGLFAYCAGLRQANATLQAVDKQIEVSNRKDRLQAHCLAVGIYPELLAISVSRERASAIIQDQFPKARNGLTMQIVALIRDVRVVVPPLLSRSVDQLYVLEEAGASVLQLFSVILQYNSMIDTLAKQTSEDVKGFDAQASATNLSGHLSVMARLLKEAEQKIEPIHDQSKLG